MAAIGREKGFKQIEHNEVVTWISDMNCPGWLLTIICRFFNGQSLTVHWQSNQSRKLPLNSGAVHGTIMGLFLLCVTFNGAGPKAHLEPLGLIITQPRKTRKSIRKGGWVDDLTVTVPLGLQDNLKQVPRPSDFGPHHFITEQDK